jgi:anti-sigma B factor antagonist
MQDFQLLLSEPSEGVLELTLLGELDLRTVETLREATQTATASGDYRCLVFDLTRLGFIDSSGLHALTETRTATAATGAKMTLVCRPGNVLKLLELTGLDRVFSIVSDRAEAIAVPARAPRGSAPAPTA